MGFLFGEYGGEFFISFWEFDFCHPCFSSKFGGNGGFADLYCSEISIQIFEFVDGWCYVFSLEVVDEVFISVDGFFPDVLLWEEVGMGQGGGCISLYNFIFLVVVRGFVCVVRDVYHSFDPVDLWVDFFQPRGSKDDIFVSTSNDVEQDSVDDPFDLNECGGDKLDDPSFIVGSIHILGSDWFGEAVVW